MTENEQVNYKFEPDRDLKVIKDEIKELEIEIVRMLTEGAA